MLDIRFTTTKAVALRLQAGPLASLLEQLHKRLGTGPCVYANEPAVLDFSHWTEAEMLANPPDLNALAQILNTAKIKWVEVRSAYNHSHFEQHTEVLGLRYEKTQTSHNTSKPIGQNNQNGQATAAITTAAITASSPDPRRTMVIEQAVRSGQKVYAHNADLVVMGPVSAGAEVIADGNIHVYGILRGRALAGAAGDTQAKIMSTCFEPQLVAIAGYYLTFESGFAEDNRSKPTLVFLDETQTEPTLGLKTISIR